MRQLLSKVLDDVVPAAAGAEMTAEAGAGQAAAAVLRARGGAAHRPAEPAAHAAFCAHSCSRTRPSSSSAAWPSADAAPPKSGRHAGSSVLCPQQQHGLAEVAARGAGRLFGQLVDLFQFYQYFPIDDHTGDPHHRCCPGVSSGEMHAP